MKKIVLSLFLVMLASGCSDETNVKKDVGIKSGSIINKSTSTDGTTLSKELIYSVTKTWIKI